jgi:CubicO group peptidase (beta-lactamase class C family)
MDLEATVSELLAEHETPGAALGLVDSGEHTIVTAGSRGADRGPVEQDTIFAAASLTKPVFALGVMTLVDDGALELDQPLLEYLPEPYLADDDRASSITARMVLSHTTGFPNWREGSNDRVHPTSGALRLRWPPGTRWGYSGEGFTYLQKVVEQLSAAPVADYLTDVVLRPLGMTESTFAWPRADERRLAIGHDERGAARPLLRPPVAKAAAGGLFTTAPDYLRFLDHCLVHEHRMFVPHAQIDEELGWGLGWGIETGEDGVWQWGNDPGYKNFVIGRPLQRLGVVVLTNGDRGADVYTAAVRELLPGPHPSLEAWKRPGWMRGWEAS